VPIVKPIVKTKITDHGWNMALRAMTKSPVADLEVGLLDDTSDIAEYGYYNEFGLGVPERSFIRSTFDENRTKYEAMLEKALEQGQRRGVPPTRGFLKLAIKMHNDIKRKITKLRSPKNADATVAAKGSSNPLIDTGAMRNAIRWRILAKGSQVSSGGS